MSRFFGDAVHAAYVVPDIKAAMQAWLDLGCGPIYLMDHVNPDARYRGGRNNPCISAAILNSGQHADQVASAARRYAVRLHRIPRAHAAGQAASPGLLGR
ncbi:MAG: hypothetical protein IPK89_08335 [Sphingomonadales bacterium]|nr:hypothetical protein [Sphingomonadales bacterium]